MTFSGQVRDGRGLGTRRVVVPRGAPAVRRFAEKVDFTGDCWLWTAATTADGYGTFEAGGGEIRKQTVYAHRFSYELLVGPIAKGLQLDHLCRVRNCVNPAHLEPVTNAVNVRRGWAARGVVNSGQRDARPRLGPRRPRSERTHCKHGHEFTPENTYYAGTVKRCRACHRADERRRYQENRVSGCNSSADLSSSSRKDA